MRVLRDFILQLNHFKRNNFFLKNLDIYDLLLIGLLVISFIVRLNSYSFPFEVAQGEAVRDYVVSSKIISGTSPIQSSWPIFGPSNGLGLINSPAYYYLLSFFLLFNNSFFSMNFANIIMQTFSIGFVYLLVRRIAGSSPALLASLLFSFDSMIMRQSLHMWMPYIMQPFLYLSYLLLYLAWEKKNQRLLYACLFIAVFAGALHNSAFVVLPTLILVALYILWKQKKERGAYIWMVVVLLVSFLVMYAAPAILAYNYFTHSPEFTEAFSNNFRIGARSGAVDDVKGGFLPLGKLIHWPSVFVNRVEFYLNYIGIIILGVLALLFVFYRKQKVVLWPALVLGFVSLQPMIALILFTPDSVYQNYNHNFALAIGTFYMFLAIIAYKLFSIFKKNGKIVFSILVLWFAVHYVPIQVDLFRDSFASTYSAEGDFIEAHDAIKNEVLRIKEEKGFDEFNFFNLISITEPGVNAGRLDEGLFWVMLEESFGEQFVYLTREGGYGTVNNLDYVFLICVLRERESSIDGYDCRDDYFARIAQGRRYVHPDELEDYVFEKEIYVSGSITVFVSNGLSHVEF